MSKLIDIKDLKIINPLGKDVLKYIIRIAKRKSIMGKKNLYYKLNWLEIINKYYTREPYNQHFLHNDYYKRQAHLFGLIALIECKIYYRS